jgi:peptidoglycan hydrolase-like protein with peptidoglycan-binding domain
MAVAVGFALVEAVSADDNVRDVQMKLRDGGFYSGEIDGAHGASLQIPRKPSNSTAAA